MRAALILLAMLAGCKDETVSGYAPKAVSWRTVELDGQPVTARATLTFSDEGRIAGEGPCNRYSASQSAPYPGFKVGPILSTRMACPDLDAEAAFFEALARATLAEASETSLILSDDAGPVLVFTAE